MMLYGGLKGLITLSKEEILNRVSQEEIFQLVFEKVDLQSSYLNPLRIDTIPKCFFKWHSGKLWFCDFADRGATPRDCFEFLKDYYNINFYQVLQYINDIFQLGLAEKDDSIAPVKPILKEVVKTSPSTSHHITFKSKNFDTYHKHHWSKYEISSANLQEDEINAVIWFRIWSDKKQDWIVSRPLAEETTYAICEWKDATKICKANSKDPNTKWFTDATKNHIGGLKKLPFTGNTLTITKSYKDWRVLTNQGLHSIWFQNEGMFPDKDKLEALCLTFDEIVIWFDNDSTGIKAAIKLQEIISSFHKKVKMIHLPIIMCKYGITDPSDCIFKEKKFFHNFINQNFNYNGQKS